MTRLHTICQMAEFSSKTEIMMVDLSRNIFPGAPLTGFTKAELIDALSEVQHFCPPRPSRQDVGTLRQAVRDALASDRYKTRMGDALRRVRSAAQS